MCEDNAPFVSSEQSSEKDRISWSELGVNAYVKIFIIAALFIYLYHIEIFQIVRKWITESSSWGHGFLIPFFSLYFIGQRKRQIVKSEFMRPNYLGLLFLICCIVFYVLDIF